MPGPIGQDYEDAATAGGSGSLNAKMRLMTSQLANLTITTVAASGGTVVSQTAGPWAVSGNVQVSLGPSLISTVNSTSSPLSGTGRFTGTFEDVSGYSTLAVSVFTDQPTGGILNSQFSSDGVNADFVGTHLMPGSGLVLAFTPRTRYFRLLYTNGPVAQGILRLQTIYHPLLTLPVTTQPMVATGDPNPTTYRIGANNQVRNPLDGTWQAMAADASGRVVVVQGLGPWAVSGTVTAMGAKTSNTGVPDGTNLGTLPAIATAAAPGYTAGNQVALSTDLSGNLRITGVVQGLSASGALFAGNPQVMAGLFTSGAVGQLVMPLATDAAGRLSIMGQQPDSQSAAPNPVCIGGLAAGSVSARALVTRPDNADAFSGGDQSLVVLSSNYISNGVTKDRMRSATAASGTTGTGLLGAGNLVYDGTNWFPLQQMVSTNTAVARAGYAGVGLMGANIGSSSTLFPIYGNASADAIGANLIHLMTNSVGMVWNGASHDRARSANAASGTTGTGLLGAGNLIYDPLVTGWFNWRGSAAGGAFVQGPGVSGAVFVGNPHVMAGLFTSGAVGQLVMPLVTDSAGRLIIGGALPNGATASAPGVSGNPVLLGMTDGTSVWSARSCTNGNAIPAPGCLAVAPTFCDGSLVNQPWNSARTGGDAAAGANFGGSATYLWNGATFDRLRPVNGASGGVGVGLMAAGGMVYDGTNWWPLKQVVGTSASLVPQGVPAGVNHLWNGTNLLTPMASTQAISDTNAGNNLLGASQYMNNGTAGNGGSFDRVRNNVLGNYFTGANTTSGATVHATATNFNNTGIMVFLNITAISGTAPSLDVKVQVADGAGTFYDLTDSAGNVVAFAQKTATGTDTLKVYPGVIEKLTAASRQYACPIPRSYRLVSTVGGNAMSITYRLDVSEIA